MSNDWCPSIPPIIRCLQSRYDELNDPANGAAVADTEPAGTTSRLVDRTKGSQSAFDLLKLNSSQELRLQSPTAALVTVLVGSRDVTPEDTVVTQELVMVAHRRGEKCVCMRAML